MAGRRQSWAISVGLVSTVIPTVRRKREREIRRLIWWLLKSNLKLSLRTLHDTGSWTGKVKPLAQKGYTAVTGWCVAHL